MAVQRLTIDSIDCCLRLGERREDQRSVNALCSGGDALGQRGDGSSSDGPSSLSLCCNLIVAAPRQGCAGDDRHPVGKSLRIPSGRREIDPYHLDFYSNYNLATWQIDRSYQGHYAVVDDLDTNDYH